ncbi:hypothetical protein FXO38_34296 [Capsicum annuum]|nr:hypothetical protein FXO38_34296 [Capsicum annuum]
MACADGPQFSKVQKETLVEVLLSLGRRRLPPIRSYIFLLLILLPWIVLAAIIHIRKPLNYWCHMGTRWIIPVMGLHALYVVALIAFTGAMHHVEFRFHELKDLWRGILVSAASIVVWIAYTLSSPYPTLWKYTGEFAIVSDLNCVASPLDFVFDMKVPNRLMVEYSGGRGGALEAVTFESNFDGRLIFTFVADESVFASFWLVIHREQLLLSLYQQWKLGEVLESHRPKQQYDSQEILELHHEQQI